MSIKHNNPHTTNKIKNKARFVKLINYHCFVRQMIIDLTQIFFQPNDRRFAQDSRLSGSTFIKRERVQQES